MIIFVLVIIVFAILSVFAFKKEEYKYINTNTGGVTAGELLLYGEDDEGNLVVGGDSILATTSSLTADSNVNVYGTTSANEIKCGTIQTAGAIRGGATTVTSLYAGTGTIQTTGVLKGGATTVTSLNAGSGTIQTSGTLQGNKLCFGNSSNCIDNTIIKELVYYAPFPKSSATTNGSNKSLVYAINLTNSQKAQYIEIIKFDKNIERVKKGNNYDTIGVHLVLWFANGTGENVWNKEDTSGTDIINSNSVIWEKYDCNKQPVKVTAVIIVDSQDNARLFDHGVMYRWIY